MWFHNTKRQVALSYVAHFEWPTLILNILETPLIIVEQHSHYLASDDFFYILFSIILNLCMVNSFIDLERLWSLYIWDLWGSKEIKIHTLESHLSNFFWGGGFDFGRLILIMQISCISLQRFYFLNENIFYVIFCRCLEIHVFACRGKIVNIWISPRSVKVW